jgi:hypothetical protein
MEFDTQDSPRTREVLLEGLRQALQARVANTWANVTLRGEPDPGTRFKTGIEESVKFYELAWKAIKDMKLG